MNKSLKRILGLVSGLALAISPLAAREFRVPTPLERAYAFSHYPIP